MISANNADNVATVSVWISGDQLMAAHPALTAATAWVEGRDQERVVLVLAHAFLEHLATSP